MATQLPPKDGDPGLKGLEQAAKDLADPPKDDVVVRRWMRRIKAAQKAKDKWAEDFRVSQCRDYVLGFQRPEGEEEDAQGQRRYQLNRIGSAFKSRIPALFYYNPFVRLQATAAREDTPQNTVDERARLLQDTVNGIIQQPQTQLRSEGLNALKEAFWSFGVVEVGFSAEWQENPMSAKPALVRNEQERQEKQTPEDVATTLEALAPASAPAPDLLGEQAEFPENETFYVRQIPAKQFLVSSNDKSNTDALDWLGYWEWMYVEDLKKTPSYQNTEDLKPTGRQGAEADAELRPLERQGEDKPEDMVPVWKIWDLRSKTRLVLAEGHDAILKKQPFNYLPVFPLRFDIVPGEWYPKPPITDQLDEQDEYNDSREFLRLVRKATVPRFLYDKNAVTPAELQKLENDEVGTFVGIEGGNMQAIVPIAQPSLSGDALRTIALSNNAFVEVSGVSEQQRAQTTGSSATEAQIVQQKSDVRNSYEQEQVAQWLGAVARGLLRCAIEKATLPLIVKMNTDPYSPMYQMDAMGIAQVWQQITQEQLQEADSTLRWDVTVDVQSLSPLTREQEATRWMQFLNLIANPGVGGLLALSPDLLKHTMDLAGIRNSKEQQAITQALMMKMQLLMAPQPGVAPMPGQPNPTPAGPPGPPPPGPPS